MGKTVRAVEDGLLRYIPKAYLKDAHHLLILHGRYRPHASPAAGPACCLICANLRAALRRQRTPAKRPRAPRREGRFYFAP